MSIKHIEDLKPAEFIHAIEHIDEYVITEKLDGMNLIVGLDEDNQMYTTRKGGDRKYSTHDYGCNASENGKKGAHAALERVTHYLQQIMLTGDEVELEVLFGRQPNAIVYGSNRIVFLRYFSPVEGELPTDIIPNDEVEVCVPTVSTPDGSSLLIGWTNQKWKFGRVPTIPTSVFPKVDLKPFKNWLRRINSLGMSNIRVLDTNLTYVAKSNRDKVSAIRDQTNEAAMEFKVAIKQQLVEGLLRRSSAFLDTTFEPGEMAGIEGVVVMNKITKKMFKIVDKTTFTRLNEYNFVVRNIIQSKAKNRNRFDIQISHSNNIVGDMINRLKNWHLMTQEYSTEGRELTAHDIIGEALDELFEALESYKSQYPGTIGYSPAVHERTLLHFAENINRTNNLLKDLHESIKNDSLLDKVSSFYGKSAIR